MNRMENRGGLTAFTLIELLVVVAILSALLAVLLPSLHAARVRARRIACAVQLRQVALAWLQYMGDNGGSFSLRGFGANPQFEFGGWPGNPWYEYATYRPVNPYVGLDANSASEAQAQVFRCPADTGDVDEPDPSYKRYGNSYIANTALGCAFGVSEGVPEPWLEIHRDINRYLSKHLLLVNVPSDTLLVGDFNWLREIDPIWQVDSTKAWHGRRYFHNLAFLDAHVEHLQIRKGIYFEQGSYRWHPFKAMDDKVTGLQKQVIR